MTATATKVAHPCPFTAAVLNRMADELNAEAQRRGVERLAVLDPFAGTGERVFKHRTFGEHVWVGLELEESFIAAPWVVAGNALRVPFGSRSFHAIASSFVFPSRMTDSWICSPEAHEKWRYTTYSHKARENRGDCTYQLHHENSGAMRWGSSYQAFHAQAINEGVRVLGSGGLFLVEMKNHQVTWEGKRTTIKVVEWFCEEFGRQGCEVERVIPIPVRGNRKGANREAREDTSSIIAARVA